MATVTASTNPKVKIILLEPGVYKPGIYTGRWIYFDDPPGRDKELMAALSTQVVNGRFTEKNHLSAPFQVPPDRRLVAIVPDPDPDSNEYGEVHP